MTSAYGTITVAQDVFPDGELSAWSAWLIEVRQNLTASPLLTTPVTSYAGSWPVASPDGPTVDPAAGAPRATTVVSVASTVASAVVSRMAEVVGHGSVAA